MLRPRPPGLELEQDVMGESCHVMSNTQILRGKIERTRTRPTRRAGYDLGVAAQLDATHPGRCRPIRPASTGVNPRRRTRWQTKEQPARTDGATGSTSESGCRTGHGAIGTGRTARTGRHGRRGRERSGSGQPGRRPAREAGALVENSRVGDEDRPAHRLGERDEAAATSATRPNAASPQISEPTLDEVLMAHREGAFTWRQAERADAPAGALQREAGALRQNMRRSRR